MLTKTAICLLCFLVLIVFAIFAGIAFGTGHPFENPGIVGASARMEFAFAWTLRLASTLIAIIAAVQLVGLAGQRDGADYMVRGGVALLGALALLNQHWVVIAGFAALIVGLIVQQFLPRRAVAKTEAPDSPSGNKVSPHPHTEVTGIQVERGTY
jgi:hypothetical protein